MVFSLAILAGGLGSRMGVRKDRLYINDRPILLHLLSQLAFVGPKVLVTAPGQQPPLGHEAFDAIIYDQTAGLGPLAGIAATVSSISTDAVVVCGVDMPNIAPEQIRWLMEALGAHPNALGILGTRDETGRTFVEPLPSIFRRDSWDAIQAHVAAGGRSVKSLLEFPQFIAIPTPRSWPPETWVNLNLPKDLQSIQVDVR